ncbi:protocatechuate 3,4-dioxygenase subunit beta [Pseudonocardiaceae bacterium YIM PH 21723]|nr:protocatechuate 3,4-dioxygenase subunit beta [Pseudonocardiaceae bacterium YIM PH 21723]
MGYQRDTGLVHAPHYSPEYRSSMLRAPSQPLVVLPHRLTEITGPLFGESDVRPEESDLTTQHDGEPLGERIVVHGSVRDGSGRPVPNTLLELWQANSAGRYQHQNDQHDAPLDPNFTGNGRCVTDAEGNYRFTTIRPGAYPWGNHHNAWRPAHLHFSVFGRALPQRLVTQMYFPGDPLLDYDPIYQAVREPKVRQRMISSFDLESTVPGWALAFNFDIVLAGPEASLLEEPHVD